MTSNPMFYQSVVALSRETHRKLRLNETEGRFAFASKTHVIPGVVDEFAAAARHLPILFAPGASSPTPVFLVGLAPGQNAFVDMQGHWREGYIPAFVRRYPFVLGETPEGNSFACIDEACPSLNNSTGTALFGEDGSDSAFLQEKIRLITDYFSAAKRTDSFASALNDLRLLYPVTIEAKAPQGAASALHGLLVVREAKLNELADEDFISLRRHGFLAMIYAHLISLKSIDALRQAAFGSSATDTEIREPTSALQ